MRQACKWIATASMSVALLVGFSGNSLWAAPQDQAAKPAYTLPEYNAYQAAHMEKDPANKIKLLDDFVTKYPMSALLIYAYNDYYQAYYAQKNYPKTLDYIDKLLALGDKVDIGTKIQALAYRAQAFFAGSSMKELQTPDALAKARDAAADGLKTLATWMKPATMTDDQFDKQKKSLGFVFNSVAGISESSLKDYKAAQGSFKGALAIDPMDALTHFRLGTAYLQDKPPAMLDGTWELSRAITLKAPGDTQIRAYLRSQVLNYQQVSCDKLVDDEISNMLTLAGSSADRPATLTLPSADDLSKARDDTANFLPWLKEGGDHGKTMWLATCGLEYPDVGVKVIDAAAGDGDNVTLKVYRPAATDPDAAAKEMDAATDANMEVHIVMQPDAKKLMKDDQVRFTGTLTGYAPSPFLLTWDMAKVNADDLKDATAAPEPGKAPTKRKPAAAKKP
jgi:tetratricopeptide (TPR) repeat protein